MNEKAELLSKFGKAITDNSEALAEIIDASGDSVDVESAKSSIRFLIAHDIVHGDVTQGYSASPILFELQSMLMRETTYRRVAPDVAQWKEDIGRDIDQLLLADKEQDDKAYVRRLVGIRQSLNSFSYSLQAELSDIDAFVQGSFGFTDSLASRRIENERLLVRVKTFLDKLAILSVQTLHKMAKDHSELEFLLLTRFSPVIDTCLSRFKILQAALDRSLFLIRQRHLKTQLVLEVKKHLREAKDFMSNDISEEMLLESKFNVVRPRPLKAMVSLEQIRMESSMLIELIKTLKPNQEKSVAREIPDEVVLDESETTPVIIETDPMKPLLDGFMKAIRTNRHSLSSVSATEYWNQNALKGYTLDHWLLYVYHQSFLKDKRLDVKFEGIMANQEKCNNYISDIKVNFSNVA